MSTPNKLPSFQQACLAADNANAAVYLVGVPATTTPGRLEVHHITLSPTNPNNPNNPNFINSKLISSSQVDPNNNSNNAWTSNSLKACFTYPSSPLLSNPIMVIQFDPYRTQFTSIRPGGIMDAPTNLNMTNLAFVSPRLFTLSGYFGAFEVFNVFTNFATNSAWMGVRLNYTNGVDQVRDSQLTNYPSRTPMIALGTYTSTLSTATQGYSIVFDTTGQGQAYPAIGNATPVLGPQDRILSLGSSYNVNMNGARLTMDAIPVTMANTGFILDKGSDGSTVVYSITPDQSAMLHRVSIAGGPPFSPAMAATALNKQIVTYSNSIGAGPVLNIFDLTTGTWSGPGLADGSSFGSYPGGGGYNSNNQPSQQQEIPIGVIVGGAIGGLVVLTFSFFLYFSIKYRIRGSQQMASNGSASAGMQSHRSGVSSAATRSQVDRKTRQDRKSGF
ncbi:hypothetical protein BGZ95_008378 [Linnemannia exigua]|uniref:Uncharacterized protein n=1 Tax=Linnemannia exigua TaxID=604196 RepID=A0AAD4DEA0_9FUNG|nr:hypothetical protein BGZ95_008378 [Linnemannia exigua]